MAPNDRGTFFRVVTALAALIVTILALKTTWFLSATNSSYPSHANRAAETLTSAAERRLESDCVGLEDEALMKCVAAVVTSTEETKRAEHDTAAQRQMAFWTVGIFWASVAGVAVTAVGLWFVWRTLEATLMGTSAAVEAAKQAAEANRILRDEQRPWVRVVPRVPNGVRLVNDEIHIEVTPVYENIGGKPAYDVWLEVEIALPGPGLYGNIGTQFGLFWTKVNNRRLQSSYPNGQIVFPNEPGSGGNFVQKLQTVSVGGIGVKDRALLPHVFVCCTYRSSIDGNLHVTARSYMLIRSGSRIITADSCDLTEEDLLLDATFQPSYVS